MTKVLSYIASWTVPIRWLLKMTPPDHPYRKQIQPSWLPPRWANLKGRNEQQM